MVRIRVAEPASDTGAVGKVMQPVTLLHQTAPKQGVTVQGSPQGGRCYRRDALSRGECLTR